MLGKFADFFRGKDAEDRIALNQRVGIKLKDSPHTFITRIEEMDKDNIHVSGIEEKELNFVFPLSGEKLELYVFSDNTFYKDDDVSFKGRQSEPIYLWTLSRPRKLRPFAERRKYNRMPNVLDVNFKVSSSLIGETKQALTKNISIGGIAMVSPEDMRLGTQVQINLKSVENISLDGKVVWKYSKPHLGKWCYGVEFMNMNEEKEACLSNYINEKLRKLRWSGL